MSKQYWKPGNMLNPLPAVMVSCGSTPEEYNIITIAWTGTINSNPPMLSISVRKNRHSYEIIKQNREFVVNLTTEKLAFATDWCGVKSGKDVDKFKEMNLTPEKARAINAPMIKESPVNIECKVKDIIELGSHDLFLAEILAVNADEAYMNQKTGAFELVKTKPLTYIHGHYFGIGKSIGRFGYSVMKPKTREKYKNKK